MSSGDGTNGFDSHFNGNGSSLSQRGNILDHDQEQAMSFRDILEKIYRRKAVVLIIFALVVIPSIIYTSRQRPVYQSAALVLVQKSKSASGSILGGAADLFQPFESDERRITNEIDILQTNLFRTNVARELLSAPAIMVDGRPDTLEIVELSKGDIKHGHRSLASVEEVASRIAGAVSFSNDRNSDIIRIVAKTHSPQESAYIANVYAKQYYGFNLNSSREMAASVREFLGKQLEDTRKQLEVAENNLQNYMQSQGIVSLDDEASQLIKGTSDFEAQRDDVVIQMESRRQVLAAYNQQLAKMEPSVTRTVSDAVDPYITMLQQEIAKLEVTRDVAVSQNPVVGSKEVYNEMIAKANSQISDLKNKLKEKTADFLNSQVMATGSLQGAQNGGGGYDPIGYYRDLRLKILQLEIDLGSMEAEKKELDKVVLQYDARFSKIPKQYIELAKLDRTEKSREKLFLLVQDSYQQAQIAEQSQFGYVQIIDPAIPSFSPISPKVSLNLTLGVLLGLALGIGAVFVLDYLDSSIKSPEDLERRGLSVLASIPIMSGANIKGGETNPEQRVMKEGISVPLRLITYHKPSDPISEAYRSLRTAIQYSRIDKPVRSLLVASALPKEGKSTMTANIAVTFAKSGLKTLLIDSDLRRPIQHKLFNMERKPGLIEYLKGEVDLNTAVRKTFAENLFLLPTGQLPPNPSEVLGSEVMKSLMEILKASFDFIVFDSPPIVAVTDGVILSKLVDGVLFVALANKTEAEVLEKAYLTLKQVKAGIIGVVLNEFDITKAYGAYYKYYKYYHYYGHKEEEKGA